METARDDGRDTPLVVVPARMPVEVAKFVHSVASKVLGVTTRCPRRRPVDEGRSTPGQGRQVTGEDPGSRPLKAASTAGVARRRNDDGKLTTTAWSCHFSAVVQLSNT